MDKAVTRLNATIAKFEAERRSVLCRLQQTCKHKRIAETDYAKLYESALPPLRVCLDCGITEEGWGCGYVILIADDEFVTRISRDELYAKRAGFTVHNDHKGPLLRREVTLGELIVKGAALAVQAECPVVPTSDELEQMIYEQTRSFVDAGVLEVIRGLIVAYQAGGK